MEHGVQGVKSVRAKRDVVKPAGRLNAVDLQG